MKSIRRFKAFCLDALTAIRELTAAINNYSGLVSDLHADIKKIEISVGYLHRVEKYQRETQGQKVNV